MNAGKFLTPSALIAIGMVCASIAMLAQNSTAAASHVLPPVQQVKVEAVTELPPVVITGKRLKVSEKSNSSLPRKIIPVTMV
ncbi:MAG TPA: hypothetical protein VNW52_09600 [Burkholderiaceae bacterium]|jgi:hypothetical protein|nr:hypothetical protein [Burkholderiaceae bacterium]